VETPFRLGVIRPLAPPRYTVYAAPEHAPGTIHGTKAEADANEEHA
jgi:hypothetical protein